jgi:AraC-like ligand binding domain
MADTPGFFDLRGGSSVRAGALAWESPDVITGWHHHPYHQLEYALSGVAEVDTDRGRYLLPPRQAMWIPAGFVHNTTLRGVRSVSIFFHPDDVTRDANQPSVVAVSPVLREMIHYAARWPINRSDITDNVAASFFGTLALLIGEALQDQLPLWLPTINDPVVAAVVSLTAARVALLERSARLPAPTRRPTDHNGHLNIRRRAQASGRSGGRGACGRSGRRASRLGLRPSRLCRRTPSGPMRWSPRCVHRRGSSRHLRLPCCVR